MIWSNYVHESVLDQLNRADWGCVTNRADWGLSLSDYLVYNNRLGLYNCKQADIAVV